jgi:hypothetical protein
MSDLTPFRIENAQCNVAFLLKSAYEMGRLNGKRCKTRIANLPQEIQDHLYSYNPEHRQQMKLVCEEIECVECANRCGAFMSINDAYEGNIYDDSYYCSKWCRMDNEMDISKTMRRNRQ